MDERSSKERATPARGRAGAVVPWVLAAALAVTLVATGIAAAGDDSDRAEQLFGDQQLKIMAPADPGGGWDQTSREMQASLQDLIGRSEVYNVGGAGGTIGISQFAQLDGQTNQLMTSGLIMVGAIAVNKPRTTLDDVTPLVRLTTDTQVVVVPDDSPIEDMADLVAAMQDDLPGVSIAGGSAGGVEQIMAGQMAQALDLDPREVNYVAHAGGGEAVATLLSGSATIGISGLSEIAPQIEAGTVRALAVSSAEPVPSLEGVPTLQESDVDVVITNWRGVMGPPGLTDEQESQLEELLVDMTRTDAWQDALQRRGWEDVTLAGPEFEEFVQEETERTQRVVEDLGLTEPIS